jgi:hypothetical protein
VTDSQADGKSFPSVMQLSAQELRKDAWHASTKTGCAALSPGSQATMYLTVSKAELGYPYRVRADYLSDSPENASSAGAWQYVIGREVRIEDGGCIHRLS